FECVVLPVEPTRAFGDRRERREQDRTEERVVVGRPQTGVGVREDRGSGLTAKILDRVSRVREPSERRSLLGDERSDERPVLVERRPAARRVLLERERQLRAALRRERGQAERAQGLIQVRCPERHRLFYALGKRSPTRCSWPKADRPGTRRRSGSRL